MKKQIKKHLASRLKIGGFIFALVGWIILVTVPLEFIGYDLSELENFIKNPAFNWGLKIFIILVLVLFLKGSTVIDNFIEKHSYLRIVLRVIFLGGVIGCIVGLGSLFIR
jgi:hypothetical protein